MIDRQTDRWNMASPAANAAPVHTAALRLYIYTDRNIDSYIDRQIDRYIDRQMTSTSASR